MVVPTKMIIDKEIIIESGPEPEIPEKRVEPAIDEKGRENEITEPGSQPEKCRTTFSGPRENGGLRKRTFYKQIFFL